MKRTEKLRGHALLATAVLVSCADWSSLQELLRSRSHAPALLPMPPMVPLLLDADISAVDASAVDAGTVHNAAPQPLIGQCTADAFAPNDSTEHAAQLSTTQTHQANFCAVDEVDYFRFVAPVAAGETFSLRVAFSQAQGDIDIALLTADDEELVASSESITDDEVLQVVSRGGEYLLEVTLYEEGASGVSSGVSYSVEFLVAGNARNDCCTQSSDPGCIDDTVRQCVCLADPHCCASDYDVFCTNLASNECEAGCTLEVPPGSHESNCCEQSVAGGCSLPSVEACVCEYAPFCCNGPFDNSCVGIAIGLCAATCGEDLP